MEKIAVMFENGEIREIYLGVEHLKMAFYAGVKFGRTAHTSSESIISDQVYQDFIRSISHERKIKE